MDNATADNSYSAHPERPALSLHGGAQVRARLQLSALSDVGTGCGVLGVWSIMAKKKATTEPKGTAAGIPVYCAFDEVVDIAALIPNPRNPNRHDDEQIRLLAKIIQHQGWRAPITVSNRSGFIVRGHGRLMAAKVLKVSEVPVDRQDYATEAEEWADLIADNRLAELATPDMPDLKDLLQELDTGALDMELTGYTEQAMADLMSQFHVPDEEKEYDESTADDVKKVTCPECGHEFPI